MPIALRSYWVYIRFLISNNNNLIITYAHVVNLYVAFKILSDIKWLLNKKHLNLVEAAEDEGEVSESLLLWKQKELTITRIL